MPKDWILVRDTERDEVKSRCLVVNDWWLLYKNAEECGFKVVFFFHRGPPAGAVLHLLLMLTMLK